MEFKLLFYSYLVLCVIVFFEVLFRIKKNSLLKICFLLVISSLFIMNYFAYVNVVNRFQFILMKAMKVIYMGSIMLAIIYLVNPKIPRWIIGIVAFSVSFLIGLRIFFYNEIDIESQKSFSNLIFSVGNELYHPSPLARIAVMLLVTFAAGLTYYYYRQFFMRMNKDNVYYKQLSRWMISLVVPFFLLVIFGVLGFMNVFNETASPYLFSFFSCTIIFSILFRPKFLNSSQVGLALVPLQKQAEPSFSAQLFKNVFFNEYYYLDKDASIAQLAEILNTKETNIREHLKQEYGMDINDLLNKHRINYMITLLDDPVNRDFTIEHISQKAGFPSRAIMSRAFSKFHGGTPKDYILQLKS